MIRGALILLMTLAATPAPSQSVAENGSTMRGRSRDASAIIAARDAVRGSGIDCRVTDALVRGRDPSGAAHYEVACEEAPGFVIVGAPEYRAISCLALTSGARRRGGSGCRLAGNRDPRRHFARMATAAGVTCPVEEGTLSGLGPTGGFIYEIACRGPEGYWLERATGGWTVKDCLTVRAEGAQCRLTPQRDDAQAFLTRLAGTVLEDCGVEDVRAMGQGPSGDFYQIRCRDRDVVARFASGGGLEEVIPCAEARRIGGGCRADGRPLN